jgi:hypothetical protein
LAAYIYVRANPIKLVDPSGRGSDPTITIDTEVRVVNQKTGKLETVQKLTETKKLESKETLSVTMPFTRALDERGLKWAREVPFRMTTKAGKQIEGVFDLVYVDPQGNLRAVEAKREAESARTPGQEEYIPELEAGANVTITGPARGPGTLAIEAGQVFNMTGVRFAVINKQNFGDIVKQQLGDVAKQELYLFSSVSADGKYTYQYFKTQEELLQYKAARVSRAIPAGQLADPAQLGVGQAGETTVTPEAEVTPKPSEGLTQRIGKAGEGTLGILNVIQTLFQYFDYKEDESIRQELRKPGVLMVRDPKSGKTYVRGDPDWM